MKMQIFDCKNISLLQVRQIANLYCEIWREPPWNEDFWAPADVSSDILQEMCKPCATLIATWNNDNYVAGFSWGYEASKNEMREIVGNNSFDSLFKSEERVAYIDELAVASNMRGSGLGKRLSSALIDELFKCGIKKITLRTDEKAMPARRLYAKLGFHELDVRDVQYATRTYWLLEM